MQEYSVDSIFMMDDWGSKNGLLINPKIWGSLFKPLYRKYRRSHCASISLGYFRDGGFSVGFTIKGDMNVTMSRINIVKELRLLLQIVEEFKLPLIVKLMIYSTTWLTTWFAPRFINKGVFKDVYSVMN